MTNYSTGQIYDFLSKVNNEFETPLSKKQNLFDLAEKFSRKATICAVHVDGKIVAMVAGYTENIVDNLAYISVVATLPEEQGKGYAKQMLMEFLNICSKKSISAVHLYTNQGNLAALNLYKNLGFILYELENEPRPTDIHLIYKFKGENMK